VGLWSRHAGQRYVVRDPRRNPAAFVDDIARLATDHRVDVVIPGCDAALHAISTHRRRLPERMLHGLPDERAVERSLDKVELERAAGAVGLPTPRGRHCVTAADARSTARELGYPVVVKPRRSIVAHHAGAVQRGGRAAASPAELDRLLDAFELPVLVQERLAGMVHSFAGIATPNGLLAACFSRYRRTWPPSAGNASFSETLPVPGPLRLDVERLTTALGWHGIFELELVPDPAGRLIPIDFNPRVYGSMALAIRAGANLPVIWVGHLLGDRPERALAMPGFSYRWEDADLRHALWLLSRGKAATAARAVRPRRGVVHAHFSAADPMPLVGRGAEMLMNGFRRARGEYWT
jgi:predicted ATP-grasp superfamily ATP-dependent carboligase